MPAPPDFRTIPLGITAIADCGRYAGRGPYWRLFSVENMVRVLVHSVLLSQLGQNWWSLAVDPGTKGRVVNRRQDYAAEPHHSAPGTHDIYYLLLSELTRILLVNSNLFLPVIPDVHQWVARLEAIRLPRNVVGHMNWLHANDIQEIDGLYRDLRALLQSFPRQGVNLVIPL